MEKEQAIEKISAILDNSERKHSFLKEALSKNKYTGIYGAGNLGRQVFGMLKDKGIRVDFFLDKSAREGQRLFEVPVIKANCPELSVEYKGNTAIIIAIFLSKEEKSQISLYLKELGYSCVVSSYSLIADFLPFSNQGQNASAEICKNKSKILGAFELMEDEHSRTIFLSN